MDKAILCTPAEMNRLQYVEESKMTFEERLRLAFAMLELSKAFLPNNYLDESNSDIKWITLSMAK